MQLNARKRLQVMIEYCETASCLRGYILNYFGEDSTGRCGACGSCAGEAREGVSDAEDAAAVKRRAKAVHAEPADEALFEVLREVRRRIAAARSLPAYVILTDAALRDMSVKKPRTMDELLDVSGVGVAKQRSFGKDLIKAINEYLDR